MAGAARRFSGIDSFLEAEERAREARMESARLEARNRRLVADAVAIQVENEQARAAARAGLDQVRLERRGGARAKSPTTELDWADLVQGVFVRKAPTEGEYRRVTSYVHNLARRRGWRAITTRDGLFVRARVEEGRGDPRPGRAGRSPLAEWFEADLDDEDWRQLYAAMTTALETE